MGGGGGGKKQQACTECTKRCLKLHCMRPSSSSSVAAASSTPLSFFKIMIGNFQHVTFIPPKFAQTLLDLVNEYAFIEDYNGHTWRVRISVVDGSLVFQQGWHDFIVDHNIEFGELLLFKYTRKLHFSVQIFATSACERLRFSMRSRSKTQKRKRSKVEISPEVLPSKENNKSSEVSFKKHCPAISESLKGERVEKNSPLELSGIKTTGRNHVIEVAGEYLTSAQKSPDRDHFGRLQTKSIMEYYETPHDRNGKDTMRVEGEERIPLIGSCIEEAMDVDSMAKYNRFPFLDNSEGLENTCLVEYSGEEKEDLIMSSRLLSNYPLSEEHTAILDYSEAIPESSVFEQEAIIMSPTISPDYGTTETQFNSDDLEKLVEDEEKELCSHDRLRRSQPASVVEYTRTESNLEGTSAVVAYPLSVKGVSTIDCLQAENLVDKDWINKQGSNTYLSDRQNIYNELDGEEIFSNIDDGGNPISSNQDSVGCVIGEAALGQTTAFVSANNIEAQKKFPTALCHLERDDNEHPIDKATMKLRNFRVCEDNLEVPNKESFLSCNESYENLRSSFEKMNNNTQSEDHLGNAAGEGSCLEYASINEIDGSHPLNMVKKPETCKDPINKERNSKPIGILPDDFPEVDQTVECSLKEKGLDAPAEGSNLNYIEDANLKLVLFFETINNDIRTEEHLGNVATMGMDSENAPIVETDASHLLNISDRPETHQNTISKERNSSQLEMDDKMVGFCLKEKATVEAATMDPTDSAIELRTVLIHENTLEVPADENSIPSFEMINGDTRSEHLGNEAAKGSDLEYASIVETDGSHPLKIADKPEIHKDPTAKERSSNQIGILPDDLPEMDHSTANFCLEGKAITVKTEIIDSIDFPSPDSANASFSIYVNATSCQKLHNKLPRGKVKRKQESRVVTLRDPSTRSWPILYHESVKFTGFLGGWKEFATANNLQNGDLRQFEVVNALESIFQMRDSKSS